MLITNATGRRLEGLCRASIAVCVCLCGLVGAGLLGVGVAGAETDLHVTGLGAPEPTIHTQVSVDGDVNGEVPPPPPDAMGTPADSTLVSSDQLYMTEITSNGDTFNQWAKVDPSKTDTAGIGDQGGYGQESARPLLNQNVASAAGRFLDPVTSRVLSLQLSKLGSDGLLTLSSANGTADPEWEGDPTVLRRCTIGSTCSLLSYANPTEDSLLTVSDGDGAPVPTHIAPAGGRVYPPQGSGRSQPATGQQWTLLGDRDDNDYFQLANKADGLCLQAIGGSPGVGSPVGAMPCADSGSVPPSQLFRIDRPSGELVLLSKLPGDPVLTVREAGGNQSCPRCELILSANTGIISLTTVWYLNAIAEPGGVLPTWSTVIPNASPATPYAVAAGDLDRVVGADGNYHDEAVVAYAGPQHHLQVRVIDYNANRNHLLVTAPSVDLPVVGADKDGTWFPGSVGVAVGAFDGGALNDIAVTWQDADGHFHVTVLAYRATADGGRALTVRGDPAGITLFLDATTTNSLASGYDQTVAGDFEGIGRDDLAIAYAGANPGTDQPSGHLGVVSFTHDLKLRGQVTTQFSIEGQLLGRYHDAGTWTSHGVRAAPGLFKFDPAQGFDFHRRELAVAWTEVTPGYFTSDRVQLFDVDVPPGCPDEECALTLDQQGPVYDVRDENPYGGDSLPISLAAGGFAGQGAGSDPPLWGLMAWFSPLASGTGGRLAGLQVTDSGLSAHEVITDPDAQFALTAYDREGASLAVGAPELITLTKLVKGSIIAAQPPAHSDWLPTAQHPDGELVNVSRNDGFAVTMGSQSTTQYDYSYTTKPGWELGVTAGIKSEGQFGFGDEKNNVGAAWSAENKFAKNWSETDATFDKYSSTITTTVTTTGTDDDIVQGLVQTYYIYRYPILGPPPKQPDGSPVFPTDCSGHPCQPIYEVTIPGQVVPADGLGRDLSFYQPSWENGNALSYPPLVDGKVPIPDLGSYYYHDEHGNQVDVTQPLVDDTIDVGGAKSTHRLEISNQTGKGHETEKDNNWDLGTEFSIGVAAKWDVLGFYGSGSISLFGGVHGGQTFASTDSGSSGSTEGDSFELDVPTIDSNKAYTIGTAYYYDKAGAQKVIHGVDLTASADGRDFWLRNYGQHPDPALNLPNATFLTYDDLGLLVKVLFNPDATRQLIRGFYALQPVNPDSPLTSGVPYATDPQAGDPVTFSVQVHNYSLIPSPAVPVQFYAVPVDSNGLNPIGPAQPIGQVQSLPIPAQGAVTVNSPTWSAQAAGNGRQNWRIFVVVDPDNTVDEIHPWKDGKTCPPDAIDPEAPAGTVVDGAMVDPMTGKPETLACGQNNQGYGTITVMPKPGASLDASASTADTHPHPQATGNPSVRLGVAAGPSEPRGSQMQSSKILTHDRGDHVLLSSPGAIPTVHLGDIVTGVIHTTTKTDTDAIQPVLIYDGPPSQGHLVAETTVDGATPQAGGEATFTWRADTPGLHTFHEKMIGTDPSEDSSDTIQVNVLPTLQAPTTHTNG